MASGDASLNTPSRCKARSFSCSWRRFLASRSARARRSRARAANSMTEVTSTNTRPFRELASTSFWGSWNNHPIARSERRIHSPANKA